MRAFTSSITIAALAAGLSLGTAGGPIAGPGVILAQSDVPATGAVQGVNPPGSLPGGNAAFGASSTNSSTPLEAAAPSGAAQGVINPPVGGQQTGTVGASTTVR